MTAVPSTADAVVALLRTQLHQPQLAADARLFDDGLLDSLSLVDLLLRLEEAFAVRVDIADVDFDSFATPAAIARFIDALRPAEQPAAGH